MYENAYYLLKINLFRMRKHMTDFLLTYMKKKFYTQFLIVRIRKKRISFFFLRKDLHKIKLRLVVKRKGKLLYEYFLM